MVFPRVPVKFCVAFWLAAMPGGTAIKIAMQKPSAMTTSAALILRLERFLNDLVIIPVCVTVLRLVSLLV